MFFSLGTVNRIEIDTTYLNIAELLAKHLNQAKISIRNRIRLCIQK
ncbi:hypothetical protein IA823_06540 [Listeria welshimeri]|nr:hypothetical protein [Listeria welshimeri]MBC1703244.1 hypothetical protein [Listeria welshimeri]MBC1784765.1 hypothetical protein [Listeria welshimeri]MBC1953567.1 hypothetical protein [Listeria welshimeri]MBC2053315.1 hypothetical protein [Listeria welshimeri]MBC2340576.1 hypothetical protein [Listeria welshimeri]